VPALSERNAGVVVDQLLAGAAAKEHLAPLAHVREQLARVGQLGGVCCTCQSAPANTLTKFSSVLVGKPRSKRRCSTSRNSSSARRHGSDIASSDCASASRISASSICWHRSRSPTSLDERARAARRETAAAAR
jgi:hypothetical protein